MKTEWKTEHHDMRMVRLLAAGMLFVLLMGTHSFEAYAQPRLRVVEGESFDLGDIREGIITKRKLTLQNAGTDTLVINDVTTSCGCTTVKPGSRKLAPGASTTLPVSIASSGYRGRVRREVRIATNDPQRPMTIVEYRSVIRTEIEFTPSYLNFSEVAKGARVVRTVSIRNRSASTIRLKSVTCDVPGISGSLSDRTMAPGDSVTLAVTFTPKERGEVKGRLKVATDRKGFEDLQISFIARVR